MRAPNGQGCCLGGGRALAIANVGDVFRHCGEYLEGAANGGYAIEVRVTPDDKERLRELYPDVLVTQLRLMALINTALQQRGIRYQLTASDHPTVEGTYPFTVRHAVCA
jgi:hypothetical protein